MLICWCDSVQAKKDIDLRLGTVRVISASDRRIGLSSFLSREFGLTLTNLDILRRIDEEKGLKKVKKGKIHIYSIVGIFLSGMSKSKIVIFSQNYS